MFQKFFISDPDTSKNKRKDHHLKKLIPNLITLGSMVCGLTSIQMAIAERWEHAVLLILVATFLDTIDGAIARLLNATSKFGAELDSLADFLSFGVAPATILYLWGLNDAGRIGWIATLIFVIASAIRLARFNATADIREEKPEWGKYFFTGVPAPAGSGIALLPLIMTLQTDIDLGEYKILAPLIGLWVFIIAGLMVSRLPTFSSKQIRLPSTGLIPSLVFIGLLLAFLVHAPWITLTVFGILYTVSIPVAYRVYTAREKRAQAKKSSKK